MASRLRRAQPSAWGTYGTAPFQYPVPVCDPLTLPKPALEAAALLHLARSSQDVFDRCVELALSTTRATTALALLHRPAWVVLEVVSAAGHHAGSAVGLHARPGEGLAWRVFDARAAYLVSDAYTQPDARFVAGPPRPGMYLGVPLLDPDGRTFGVLSVDTVDSTEILDEIDVQTLSLLGQAAGVAYARLNALEQARQTAWRFQRLAQFSADLELRDDPDEIARLALDTLMDLSSFSSGGVFGVREGRIELRLAAGRLAGAGPQVIGDWLPRMERLVQQTCEGGVTIQLHPDDPWWHTPLRPPGTPYSALITPLRLGGQVVGAIGLGNAERRPISPEVVTMLEMVAARIDRAVERVSGLEQLRQMREGALRGLGRVLERRDDETFGHTDRVTTLAVRLGEALGLSGEQLRHLRWGAYLHDIGKVAVPDAVLRKPGPLTDEERCVMQTHTLVGDELLQDDAFLPRAVAAVVRHHHERWDGAGYPDGLAGEQIPLLARVFSVVDVYDALISERPYKRAWTRQAALAELARCAGSQFDPQVVEAFLALEDPR